MNDINHTNATNSPDLDHQLSEALKLGKLETPPAPDVNSRIDQAISHASKLVEQDPGLTARSMLPTGQRRGWQLAAGAVLILCTIAAVAFWPARINMTPKGMDVQPGIAWAAVDGYVLGYTIDFDEQYTGTADDSAQHPLWQFQKLIDQWAANHETGSLSPACGKLVELDFMMAEFLPVSGKNYRYHLQLKVYDTGEEILDSLVNELCGIEGLSEPEISSEQWYYRDKFPETHYTGRLVIINDRTYHYPTEIDVDSLPLLNQMLYALGSGGQMYYALADIEEFQRYQLGDVIRVEWGDDDEVLIDTLPDELDFESLGMPSWYQTASLFIPESSVGEEFDPVQLIRSRYASMMEYPAQSLAGIAQRVVVDLLPYSEWLGVDPETLVQSVPAARITELEHTAGKLDEAVIQIKKLYPDIGTRILPRTHRENGMPTQWYAEMNLYQSQLVEQQLLDAIKAITAAKVRIIPHMPASIPGASLPVSMQGELKEVFGAQVIYAVVPEVHWMGMPMEKRYEWLTQKISTMEIDTARERAKKIERAYTAWIKDKPELKEEIFSKPGPTGHSTRSYLWLVEEQDIILSVHIFFWFDDSETAQATADEFISHIEQTTDISIKPGINKIRRTVYSGNE